MDIGDICLIQAVNFRSVTILIDKQKELINNK